MWLAINPWCHSCNIDTFAKTKRSTFCSDCYFFKSKGYNIQSQVIVDHVKQFRDIFIGIPSFVNDVWKSCNFFLLIVGLLMETCLLLIMQKKGFGHTSLVIKGIPSCLSWWCPTRCKSTCNILFLKHYLINNYLMAKVWWRTFSRCWKRCFGIWYWKQVYKSFFY